jgi:1-deoxy-D-xylulose-5-phosphate synthase
VNARFVKPLDETMIHELAQKHTLLCTLEENVYQGSYGQTVGAYLAQQELDVKYLPIAIPNRFVEHGSVPQLRQMLEMDGEHVAARILEAYRKIDS